jgi:hypothetical protein
MPGRIRKMDPENEKQQLPEEPMESMPRRQEDVFRREDNHTED